MDRCASKSTSLRTVQRTTYCLQSVALCTIACSAPGCVCALLTVSRYLKCIDKFFNNYISCFVTGAGVKFLLLHQPIVPTSTNPSRTSTAIGANPTSPATEEAIKLFFTEVYENWVKAVMSPFYKANMEVTSPVFRARVSAAGRKYL